MYDDRTVTMGSLHRKGMEFIYLELAHVFQLEEEIVRFRYRTCNREGGGNFRN